MARLRCFQHHLSGNNVFFFRYQITLVNYAAFSLTAPKTWFCSLAAKLGCFELYVACSLLKYGVLSFIAPKTCFALFAVKLGIFQHYCSGEWISFPIFNEWRWFLLDGTQKNVLACFWLSYAVLSIIFLRTTFTTFSYMKYVFDALTYRKHLLVCFQRIWAGLSFCAHKPKHAFPAIQLKEAYLHTRKKTLFYVTQSSNQPSLATNATGSNVVLKTLFFVI